MKRCFKCKKKKKLSEFYKDSYTKDGYNSRCKDCWRIYRVQNREYYLAYDKRYNTGHRAKALRQTKEWNKANYKRMREQQHLYFRSPRGKAASKRGCYKRRALLATCKVNNLTTPQIRVLLQSESVNCPICGKPFNNNGRKKSIDHVIPLSKRGNNTLSNIRVICLSCNSKKSNKVNILI